MYSIVWNTLMKPIQGSSFKSITIEPCSCSVSKKQTIVKIADVETSGIGILNQHLHLVAVSKIKEVKEQD